LLLVMAVQNLAPQLVLVMVLLLLLLVWSLDLPQRLAPVECLHHRRHRLLSEALAAVHRLLLPHHLQMIHSMKMVAHCLKEGRITGAAPLLALWSAARCRNHLSLQRHHLVLLALRELVRLLVDATLVWLLCPVGLVRHRRKNCHLAVLQVELWKRMARMVRASIVLQCQRRS
jgi:hypothetical protein